MAVAPDLLLNSAAEIKPRSAPPKASAKPAEPSRNESSSFSQVYAKERQAQVAERKDAAVKQAREDHARAQERNQAVKEPAQGPSAQEEAVADSGNKLPGNELSDEELESEAVDPLLLFGMGGELPASALAEQASALLANPNLQGSGPASMTAASFDPEQDALNQLSAVRMALNIGAQSQAQADKGAVSAENMGQSLLASQLMAEGGLAEGETLELGDLELQGLTGKSLEALKEGTANSSSENFVSKLNALSQAVNQQSSAARAPLFGQPLAMQQGGWSEAVVDRVMLMSSQNLKSAEIQLDPAELGRLEVRISVSQEQSQVTFASPHAGVREALDSQMHRLREMFAQQGMNQLDVSVSDQSLNRGWQGQEGQAGDGGRRGGGDGLGGADDEAHAAVVESAPQLAQRARSLVDYYA